LAVEEFCLSAGETEVNEVDLGEAPGWLEKVFVPPFCNVEANTIDGVGAQQIDGLDCNNDYLDYDSVAMAVAILNGSCADAVESAFNDYTYDDMSYEDLLGDCDGISFFGGADDLITIDGLPLLAIALAPGDYTICWAAEWTYNPFGDFEDYIDSGVICDEFTITSGETTDLINYSDDHLLGSIDVFVEADTDGTLPLNDILVLLFDQDNNLIAWDCTGDSYPEYFDGWVHFYDVPEGVYTVTATDSASTFDGIYPCGDGDFYETQSATISYNVFEDYPVIHDWLYDPVGDPDVIIHLDPAGAP
jgi:hypothetical protein